jgi:hypothetical protein
MSERRSSPRAKCQLHCRFVQGSKLARAQIVDVSEGGLCLLSPVPIARETLALQIDVPGGPPVEVEAATWHLRRVEHEGPGATWCIGMMVTKAGDGYDQLLPGLDREPVALPHLLSDEEQAAEVPELAVFRVRVRSNVTKRLTLAAISATEARELAAAELGAQWTVIEVREV